MFPHCLSRRGDIEIPGHIGIGSSYLGARALVAARDDVGAGLGANVLVEKVFAWPGIGSYAIEALIAPNFHFTSPLDTALDRATYFERCWPNSRTIEDFTLVHLIPVGERVFELIYLKNVHSEADTAVWLPKEHVVFSASGKAALGSSTRFGLGRALLTGRGNLGAGSVSSGAANTASPLALRPMVYL